MKIVNTGNVYTIYDDSLQTFDKLPAQTYKVCFHPQKGFWLESFIDLEVNEKIYGVHEQKVQKVFQAFEKFERNLGIILSGDKGIGKSLFAKMASIKAVQNGYPLIIVTTYIPGIADFLSQIDQEIVVLLDEFDKTFNEGKDNSNNAKDPQTEMLTLFDGINSGKKMFIVTCNDLKGLNDYLVNRPGRFHYHFRFEYPQAEEIREYMRDKLAEEYWKEIEAVVSFSKKISLNFDCLRAIAFELSLGVPFKEAIQNLNIVNIQLESYNLYLYFEDGTKVANNNFPLDMFAEEDRYVDFPYEGWYDAIRFCFSPVDGEYDMEKNGIVIKADNFSQYEIDDDLKTDERESVQKIYRKLSQSKPDFLLIKRKPSKNIYYAV